MSSRGSQGLLQWLGVATLTLLLDQFTKLLILMNYHYGQATHLTDWLNIVRVHNRGAAFSFLANAAGWQRWFFVGLGIIAVAFMLYLMLSHAGQRLFCFALALLMGGALGNVLDRLIHGYVVDMIDFHIGRWHFPAFNLADAALTLGVVFLLIDELRRVRRTR
jgi:signal peptidase II